MNNNETTVNLFEIFEEFNSNYSEGSIERLSNTEITFLINKITALYRRNSYLGKVQNFMKVFKQPIPKSPEVSEILSLRLSLLLEELAELAESCGQGGLEIWKQLLHNHISRAMGADVPKEVDLVACFDALIDLQYVLTGTVQSFGMQEKFDEGFNEVHNSNMSKLCYNEDEAIKTVEWSRSNSIDAHIVADDKYFLVFRNDNKKVVKSINYYPVKLDKILFPQLIKSEES